jgi:hypothetical protein
MELIQEAAICFLVFKSSSPERGRVESPRDARIKEIRRISLTWLLLSPRLYIQFSNVQCDKRIRVTAVILLLFTGSVQMQGLLLSQSRLGIF